MDIHEKHETDLTRKERRDLEKEKLSGMDWKQKLEYIWAYYKPQIFGVIAFFLIIWGGVSWYQNAQKETILYTVAIDGYATGDTEKELEADFKEYLGDEDKDHILVFDTSVFSAAQDSQAAYNSTMKLNTIVAAGAVDIVIAPKDQLDQFTDQGIVYQLSEVMSPELMEKYQDSIVDGERLSVSGNKILEKSLNIEGDDFQLVVLNMGPNKENAEKFIEYILEN